MATERRCSTRAPPRLGRRVYLAFLCIASRFAKAVTITKGNKETKPWVWVLHGHNAPGALLPGESIYGRSAHLESKRATFFARPGGHYKLQAIRQQNPNPKWKLQLLDNEASFTVKDVEEATKKIVQKKSFLKQQKRRLILVFDGHGKRAWDTRTYKFCWGGNKNSEEDYKDRCQTVDKIMVPWIKVADRHFSEILIIITSCFSGSAAEELMRGGQYGLPHGKMGIMTSTCSGRTSTFTQAMTPFPALFANAAHINFDTATLGIADGPGKSTEFLDWGRKWAVMKQELGRDPNNRKAIVRNFDAINDADWIAERDRKILGRWESRKKCKLATSMEGPLPSDASRQSYQTVHDATTRLFRDLSQVLERSCNHVHIPAGWGVHVSRNLKDWGFEINTLHVTAFLAPATLKSWSHIDDWRHALALPKVWRLKQARFAYKMREGQCQGITSQDISYCNAAAFQKENKCPTLRCRWSPSPMKSQEWREGQKALDHNARKWGLLTFHVD